MLKLYLKLFCFIFLSLKMSAQEDKCETASDDVLLDLNSLTKCLIETGKDGKKSNSINVKVSSRRVNKNSVSRVANGLDTQEVVDVNARPSVVKSLDLGNETTFEKISFDAVQEVPIFKDCKKAAIIEQKKCFTKEMYKHISLNLKYPQEAEEKNIQGRVLTQFVINKDGSVSDVVVRVPYDGELLGKEAERIISELPEFEPGKHDGKIVKVIYGIPISFKIPGKEPSNVKIADKEVKLENVYSFKNVDVLPMFKGCEASNDSSEDCFNENLIKHISSNLTYPLKAIENNIEGKVIAHFVIDSKGEVVNIRTRTIKGRELLENATKELIRKLPIFKPGILKNKRINVSHAFPITFKLQG